MWCDLAEVLRVRHDLGGFAEAKHHVLYRAATCSTPVAYPAEQIAQRHESDESLLARSCEYGELIETFLAHSLDGIRTGGCGGDGGDGLEAEGLDCGVFERRFVFRD